MFSALDLEDTLGQTAAQTQQPKDKKPAPKKTEQAPA